MRVLLTVERGGGENVGKVRTVNELSFPVVCLQLHKLCALKDLNSEQVVELYVF